MGVPPTILTTKEAVWHTLNSPPSAATYLQQVRRVGRETRIIGDTDRSSRAFSKAEEANHVLLLITVKSRQLQALSGSRINIINWLNYMTS